MVSSRTATALAGLAISLAISALAWWYYGTVLLFLFVPFVPVLFRRANADADEREQPSVRECPRCGFRTADREFDYCPRDGSRLR